MYAYGDGSYTRPAVNGSIRLYGIHAMRMQRRLLVNCLESSRGKRLNLLQFVSYLPLLVSDLLHLLLHATYTAKTPTNSNKQWDWVLLLKG